MEQFARISFSIINLRGDDLRILQAGAGLVADSVPQSEFEETTNKAAALGRAIDLAEQAFLEGRQS